MQKVTKLAKIFRKDGKSLPQVLLDDYWKQAPKKPQTCEKTGAL